MKKFTSPSICGAARLSVALAASIISASELSATVEPAIISLDDSSSSYTIPTGKVFIVDSVLWNVGTTLPDDTSFQLSYHTLNRGSSSFVNFPVVVSTTFTDARLVPLSKPLFLKGGWGVSLKPVAGVVTNEFMFIGRLADTADVYAQIPAQLENPGKGDGTLMADLRLASPRPAMIKVEKSTDLAGFTPAAATITATNSKSLAQLVIPDENERRLFMRAVATARPSDADGD